MRFPIRIAATLILTAALALPALAGDRLSPVMAQREGRAERLQRLERFLECLSILALTDEQKSEIRGVLEAARPDFQAARESVRAAREKLAEDVTAGAGECAVGADYLALHGSLEAFRARLAAVREPVLSKLTPEQAARLAGCLDAPRSED